MEQGVVQTRASIAGFDPAQRIALLAEARERASAAALERARVAESRRAEQRAAARAIFAEAAGANTTLSIARDDAIGAFVYRAVDRTTGEVVREWPPVQFERFLRQSGVVRDVAADALAGLVVDERA